MELEFYDQSRADIVHNFWDASFDMFKKRLEIYMSNNDLLQFK